jgi:transcriptional regulator with GAF, ATPase, and Fis domain
MRTYKDFRTSQKAAEKAFVRSALVRNRWRCVETATALEIAPSTLVSLVKRVGLWDEYRAARVARKKS